MNSREIELVKSLLISREILVVELQKISSVIDQKIDDLTEADLNFGIFGLSDSTLSDISGVSSGGKMGVGQLAGIFQGIVEVFHLSCIPDSLFILYFPF